MGSAGLGAAVARVMRADRADVAIEDRDLAVTLAQVRGPT
jgi:hypothetical protein